MSSLIQEHQETIWWITAISLAMLIGSAIVVPWIVVRIPSDFFLSSQRPDSQFSFKHPVLRWAIWIFRNLLGVVLFLAGLAMLILPGQGLLTLAMAVVVLDFRGKHKLERWIIQMPPVLKSINWLRSKANVEPLQIPQDSTA